MNPSRHCPACGAMARVTLHDHRFAVINGVSVIDGYAVVSCTDCGMTFADCVPAQDTLDRYYRDASKYAYGQRDGAESPSDAARLAITADTIATLVSDRAARILDVGCATGRLIAELRDRGFANVSGIDPSPAAAEAAQRIHGVRVDVATLAEAAAAGQKADVVLLVGVLEHLADLDSTVAALHSVLAPTGRVYLEVPDVTGFADWPNAPYQELSVEHINYFSAATIARALGARGLPVTWHQRNTRLQTTVTRVANLSVFAQCGSPSAAADRDSDSAPSMMRYLERAARGDLLVRDRIAQIARAHPRVLVWGVGTLTLRLLASGGFSEIDVVAFVDSNPRYHGKTVNGAPIVSPAEISGFGLPVIYASWGFREEMADQLQDSHYHKVIRLPVFDEQLSRNLSIN